MPWPDPLPDSSSGGLKKYEWSCPHPGCKYSVTMYGTASLEIMKDLHANKHLREAREALIASKEELKDYNKLELTAADKAFLKTRGIKAD